MKSMVQLQTVKFLTWFLSRLAPEPKVFALNLEASMKTLDALYGTSAVHAYLDGREAYLKEVIVQALMDGKLVNADKTAGGLYEIRAFRDKLKAAHVYMQRIKKETLTQQQGQS